MSEPSATSAVGPHPTLPRNVKVLGWVSLLNDVAGEMIVPLLPTFLLTVLKGNQFILGVIEGAADTVASLSSGGWSDRVGRRKGFVLFGYALAAVVRPLIGIVTAPWQLFAIRVADRSGKAIRSAPRDAMIAESADTSMHGRAFGFHQAMDHVGAAVGPLLAAAFLWLWPDRLRLLFLLTVVPGALVVALIIFGLRQPPTAQPRVWAARWQWSGLTLKPFGNNFRLFLVVLVIFSLGNSSDAFLLVRAAELGVPVVQLPLLWCAFHIVKSAGNLLLGRAADRFGPRSFLVIGWFIYAAVYLGFSLATNTWQAWALFGGYAIFYGLTEPSGKAMVATLVGKERMGLAYGWYNLAIGIATLPASMIFGALYQNFKAPAAFGFGAALALIAAVLLLAVRRGPDQENFAC